MNNGFKAHIFKPSPEMKKAFEGYSEFSDLIADILKPRDFSVPEFEKDTHRVCRKCFEKLPFTSFNIEHAGKHRYECKACRGQIRKHQRIEKAHEEGKTVNKRSAIGYKDAFERQCTVCNEIKKNNKFSKDGRGGHKSKCKQCLLRMLREKTAIKKQKNHLKATAWGSIVQSHLSVQKKGNPKVP